MKKNVLILASIFLLTSPLVANAEKWGGKPLPICPNIKSYMAYEMAVAVKERCDQNEVQMRVGDLHRTFESMLSEKEVSPSECNAVCLVVSGKMSIDECIKTVLVSPFVDSMMLNGTYNKDTCEKMRARLKKAQ